MNFWWSLPSPKIRLPGLHPRPQNHLSLVAGGALARDKKRDRWIFTNSTLFSFPKYPVVDHLRKPFDQITFRKLNTGFRKTFLGESSITKHMNTTPVRVKLLFQIPSVKPALSQSWKPIQSNHVSKATFSRRLRRLGSSLSVSIDFDSFLGVPPHTNSQPIETEIERSSFLIIRRGWHEFLLQTWPIRLCV